MSEWDKLRDAILANPMTHTHMVATMPLKSPMHIMGSMCDGIHPVCEPFIIHVEAELKSPKSKYYRGVR